MPNYSQNYKPPRKHYDMFGKVVYVNYYLVDLNNKRIIDKQMQRADTIKYTNQKIASQDKKWMRWDQAKQYAKNPNATFKENTMKLMELIDTIPGGKGDNTNPSDVDQKQLEIGIAVEKEHTNDVKKAEEIALDHLTENPKYYTELVKSGVVDEKEAMEIYNKYFGIQEAINEEIHFDDLWHNKYGNWSIGVYTKTDKNKFENTVESAITKILGGDTFNIKKFAKGFVVSFPEYYANKESDKTYRKKLHAFTDYLKNNLNETILKEKSTSKAQQQAAGIAYAAKKGEIPKSKLKGASKNMAKMDTKELKKFAKTKTNNLPQHVKEAYLTQDYLDKHKDEIKKGSEKNNKMSLGNLVKKDDVKEEETPVLTFEDKKCFLEDIKKLEEYGQKLYSPVDLVELAEKLSALGQMAERVTLEETDDWFDKVTINRNMKEVRKISEDITKTATEAKSVQQRLTSLYEDLKHVLGRYFEITDLGANNKAVVQDQEGDIYNPGGQNASFDYLKSNFEDFRDADEANKMRIKRAKRNIS